MLTSTNVLENYIIFIDNAFELTKTIINEIKLGTLPKIKNKNLMQSSSLPKSEKTEIAKENSTIQNKIVPNTVSQDKVLFIDTAREDINIAEEFIKNVNIKPF